MVTDGDSGDTYKISKYMLYLLSNATTKKKRNYIKECRAKEPFIQRKNAWTLNDFLTVVGASARVRHGRLILDESVVEKVAFDTRIPEQVAKFSQSFLITLRDTEGLSNKERIKAMDKVFEQVT